MLQEAIDKDYIQAMKARDALRSSTLSFLRAQLKNVIIDKRLPKLEDADVVSVIKKQIKQRQDSIEQYKAGGRNDLADKETQELEILKSYLPAEMPAEAINAIIKEAIKATGAKSMKEMGLVMKEVSAKTAGQADNKLVSELVKTALSQL